MYPIKHFRAARNLTQAQLGRLVGRSRGCIANWESGVSQPDVAAVRLLEQLRDKPIEELRGIISGNDPSPDLPHSAQRFVDFIRRGAKPRVDLGDEQRSMRVIPQNATERVDLESLRALSTINSPGLVSHEDFAVESPLQLSVGLGRLGAVYIQSDAPLGEITIPMIDADPPIEWLAEGDSHSGTGDPVTSGKEPSWKTASALLHATRKLRLLGVPDGGAALARAFLRAVARGLDTAALVGDGITEPQGLLAVPGTQAIDALGSFDAATLDQSMRLLGAAGVDASNVGAVANENVREVLSAVQYNGRNAWNYEGGENLAARPAMVAPAMPAGVLALGDFSQIKIIHQPEVALVQVAQPDDSSKIFHFLECTVQVVRPSGFVVVSNV